MAPCSFLKLFMKSGKRRLAACRALLQTRVNNIYYIAKHSTFNKTQSRFTTNINKTVKKQGMKRCHMKLSRFGASQISEGQKFQCGEGSHVEGSTSKGSDLRFWHRVRWCKRSVRYWMGDRVKALVGANEECIAELRAIESA